MTFEQLQRLETGKILRIEGKKITVKVDGGIIDLEAKDPLPFSSSVHRMNPRSLETSSITA